MAHIRNTTRSPLRVHLPGGKILHLGPGHSAHVPDAARELESFRRMLDGGSLVIEGEDEQHVAGRRPAPVHDTSTHGHTHTHRPHVTGDR